MTETTAVLWGSEPPAFSIGHCEPMWPGDSGFSILFADAPDPDDMEDDEPGSLPEGITLVHLGCLLNDYPELGRGTSVGMIEAHYGTLVDTAHDSLLERLEAAEGGTP